MLKFKIGLKGLLYFAFEAMEEKRLCFNSGLGGKIAGEKLGTRGYLEPLPTSGSYRILRQGNGFF